MNKLIALLAALAFTASLASADPTIVVGTNMLLPNTAGQIVNIYVTGGDDLQNVDLYVKLGDGGVAWGGTAGPRLTNVDVITGTIFAANNTDRGSNTTNGIALDGSGNPCPQLGYEGTTTQLDEFGWPTFVTANGLLATLTIDTTGYTSGTWALSLTSDFGNTAFVDDFGMDYWPTNITNGTITILPGDFNKDRHVTDADYTIWSNYYQQSVPAEFVDGNGDGTYTDADYTIWAEHYGQSSGAGNIVPEPATMSLLGLGLLGLIRRR